jgi:hypothetical protein
MFENMVLRIFGPKRVEEIGGWRKLRNEKLRDLYSTKYNYNKKLRMGWVGHVARMGRRETGIVYWWESQREGWDGRGM